jgi:hypothetical protein
MHALHVAYTARLGHPLICHAFFFLQDPWSASYLQFQLVRWTLEEAEVHANMKNIACYKNVNIWIL